MISPLIVFPLTQFEPLTPEHNVIVSLKQSLQLNPERSNERYSVFQFVKVLWHRKSLWKCFNFSFSAFEIRRIRKADYQYFWACKIGLRKIPNDLCANLHYVLSFLCQSGKHRNMKICFISSCHVVRFANSIFLPKKLLRISFGFLWRKF